MSSIEMLRAVNRSLSVTIRCLLRPMSLAPLQPAMALPVRASLRAAVRNGTANATSAANGAHGAVTAANTCRMLA